MASITGRIEGVLRIFPSYRLFLDVLKMADPALPPCRTRIFSAHRKPGEEPAGAAVHGSKEVIDVFPPHRMNYGIFFVSCRSGTAYPTPFAIKFHTVSGVSNHQIFSLGRKSCFKQFRRERQSWPSHDAMEPKLVELFVAFPAGLRTGIAGGARISIRRTPEKGPFSLSR